MVTVRQDKRRCPSLQKGLPGHLRLIVLAHASAAAWPPWMAVGLARRAWLLLQAEPLAHTER
jgi:hypothetical protein